MTGCMKYQTCVTKEKNKSIKYKPSHIIIKKTPNK